MSLGGEVCIEPENGKDLAAQVLKRIKIPLDVAHSGR